MFGFGKKPKAPQWASFFNGAQFEMFMDRVRAYLDLRGDPYTIEDGVIHVHDANDKDQAYGMLNLAQACHQIPPDDWDALIEYHFSNMASSLQEHNQVTEQIEDFSSVRERLALRLYPPDYVAPEDKNDFARRTDLEGVISTLVLDMPSSIITITGDTAQQWNIPRDELFQIALENIRRMPRPTPVQMELNAPNKCWFINDASFLTATYALMLEEFPDCLGSKGTLVAIPARHVVVCYPIESLEVVGAIGDIILIAKGMERDGPGSISANLYLRKPDGAFLNLPYVLEDNTLKFSPPDEFVELLNSLGRSDGGEVT